MRQPQGFRYYYRGNATAFGGQIYRPSPEILESHGATSLPVTGGYSSARTERFRHREMITFEAAYSQVTGSQSPDESGIIYPDRGSFDTLITSVVEKLNIAGMITADRIIARLSAEHPNQDNSDPRITLLGSEFVNLRIAGCPVRYESYAGLLDKGDTLEKLQRALDSERDGKQFVADARWDRSESFRAGASNLSEYPGVLPCSLFKNVHCSEGIWEPQENAIVIPQFGTIYLGEVLISRKSRRLTMLRVEMGSPMAADLSASIVEGDGFRIP